MLAKENTNSATQTIYFRSWINELMTTADNSTIAAMLWSPEHNLYPPFTVMRAELSLSMDEFNNGNNLRIIITGIMVQKNLQLLRMWTQTMESYCSDEKFKFEMKNDRFKIYFRWREKARGILEESRFSEKGEPDYD